MFKNNGRLAPAPKEEVAKLKGKIMVCSNCKESFSIEKASFADERCTKCGGSLIDTDFEAAGKTTGK